MPNPNPVIIIRNLPVYDIHGQIVNGLHYYEIALVDGTTGEYYELLDNHMGEATARACAVRWANFYGLQIALPVKGGSKNA